MSTTTKLANTGPDKTREFEGEKGENKYGLLLERSHFFLQIEIDVILVFFKHNLLIYETLLRKINMTKFFFLLFGVPIRLKNFVENIEE